MTTQLNTLFYIYFPFGNRLILRLHVKANEKIRNITLLLEQADNNIVWDTPAKDKSNDSRHIAFQFPLDFLYYIVHHLNKFTWFIEAIGCAKEIYTRLHTSEKHNPPSGEYR